MWQLYGPKVTSAHWREKLRRSYAKVNSRIPLTWFAWHLTSNICRYMHKYSIHNGKWNGKHRCVYSRLITSYLYYSFEHVAYGWLLIADRPLRWSPRELMLRGALSFFADHRSRSLSPISMISANFTHLSAALSVDSVRESWAKWFVNLSLLWHSVRRTFIKYETLRRRSLIDRSHIPGRNYVSLVLHGNSSTAHTASCVIS